MRSSKQTAECLFTNLHAKCNNSDHHLEDQGQGQLPQRRVKARSRWPVSEAVIYTCV